MSEKDYAPLSSACVRALRDRLYDKRKTAAQEIELMVKEANSKGNMVQVKRIIKVLNELATSQNNPNTRKGGLIGLAAVAVGLGREATSYTEELINPMLASFADNDEQIRRSACESLYNVIKVVRDGILPYFKDVFNALSRLACDSDQGVKNGSELLDRLLKDVVTECPLFDLKSFIPLLRERIYAENSFTKQFVISWVAVLDAVPDIDLIIFLPELLDGLFKILKDPMLEIKKMCETILAEFLRSIKTNPSRVQFNVMINVLTVHAQSNDELLQLTAITWIKEFVQLSGVSMLPHISAILTAILPCLAYDSESKRNIKDTATAVNLALMKLVTLENVGTPSTTDTEPESQKPALDVSSIVSVLTLNLADNSVQTKIAVLRWLHHLFTNIPLKMNIHFDEIFRSLLSTLTDPSDDVVQQSLVVIAEIISRSPCDDAISSTSNMYYILFVNHLLKLFRQDKRFLEEKGALIVRQLCTLISAEEIYKTLAQALVCDTNLKFVAIVVQTLNMILMTSTELYHLRNQLRQLATQESVSLFSFLHETWCHSPVALLSLCFLTQNYRHACNIIRQFANIEITVDILVEVDKLIQLIESPIFAYLRLELLNVPANEDLLHALYGLLMLIPQSDAFETLRKRLACVPNYQMKGYAYDTKTTLPNLPHHKGQLDFERLLADFIEVQERHRVHKQTQRLKHLKVGEDLM